MQTANRGCMLVAEFCCVGCLFQVAVCRAPMLARQCVAVGSQRQTQVPALVCQIRSLLRGFHTTGQSS